MLNTHTHTHTHTYPHTPTHTYTQHNICKPSSFIQFDSNRNRKKIVVSAFHSSYLCQRRVSEERLNRYCCMCGCVLLWRGILSTVLIVVRTSSYILWVCSTFSSTNYLSLQLERIYGRIIIVVFVWFKHRIVLFLEIGSDALLAVDCVIDWFRKHRPWDGCCCCCCCSFASDLLLLLLLLFVGVISSPPLVSSTSTSISISTLYNDYHPIIVYSYVECVIVSVLFCSFPRQQENQFWEPIFVPPPPPPPVIVSIRSGFFSGSLSHWHYSTRSRYSDVVGQYPPRDLLVPCLFVFASRATGNAVAHRVAHVRCPGHNFFFFQRNNQIHRYNTIQYNTLTGPS